jgi:hypothetical protein
MRRRKFFSRRSVLASVLGALSTLTARLRAFAIDKLAKTDVDYRDRPRGAERCDNCRVWVPPNACKPVEGTISPKGWCNIWRSQAPTWELTPNEEDKLTKGDVAYQNRSRNRQSCESCDIFQPPDACASVQGAISPKGWCNIWRRVKDQRP